MLTAMQLPLAADIFGFTPVQVALFGSAIALIYAIRRWRMNTIAKRKAATSSDASPARGSSATHQPSALNVREITIEIHALLADVEETARRITSQLDNRYTRLEQLMVEADEKIRQLEAMGTNATPANSAPPASSFAMSNSEVQVAPARTNFPPTSAPPFPAASSAAPALSDAQRALSRLRHERGAPPAAEDPAYQPIYTLADRGKTSREIAQELSRQPGEIELILALRQHT
jgi:hypothetical protein